MKGCNRYEGDLILEKYFDEPMQRSEDVGLIMNESAKL